MNIENETTRHVRTAGSPVWLVLVLATVSLQLISTSAEAEVPEFTFNDRCVPYQIHPDFMLANGVDPSKVTTSFGATPTSNPNAPWIEDVDEFDQPVPCDEFHTAKRRTRYEGCHFYDGTPCYFTTNGQMDQDAFTDDDAGRIAQDIAEHFVIYEVVQNYRASPTFPAPNTGFFEVIAPAADPFCCGFAVGNQVKILNAANTYFEDDPLGIWKIGFITFVEKSFECGAPALPDPLTQTDDCVYLNTLRATNGLNAQSFNIAATQNDPLNMPLIFTGDEIFELLARGLVSLRYRTGGDGGSGVPEGPRYILCPVHEDPANNTIAAGLDIIQGWPTHLEFQPPCSLSPEVDPADLNGRGHLRVCEPHDATPEPCGDPGEPICIPAQPAYPFGLTPPPGEQDIYDQFDCLQRTGNWCP